MADNRGVAMRLFFGFAQCPYICRTALSRAAEVMQRLGPQAERLQVIFMTIDPARDMPALPREYTRGLDHSFISLRGDAATTAMTAEPFKVFYRKVPKGSRNIMDHAAISHMFDPLGRLRLTVKHGQPAGSLASDVGKRLKGARS